MGKRYKEFLIDILTKAYQIILAGVVITPFVTKGADPRLLSLGLGVVLVIIFWAGTISAGIGE